MLDVPMQRFEALVADALDSIPADLLRLISNCVIVVEDEAPADQPELLGLYQGTPLTERGSWYSAVLPDRITIFRLPILRMCRDEHEVRTEVRITVIHELAHHFGIDDQRLHDLGWA